MTDTFTENERQSLRSKARDILALNDRGRYTVPTHGLYPFHCAPAGSAGFRCCWPVQSLRTPALQRFPAVINPFLTKEISP